VETRSRTLPPSASEMRVTLHRFGREGPLGLDVGMADLVADQLACQNS